MPFVRETPQVMTSLNVVPLREEQLGPAARALARAFHDDPLQSYVFPDPAERAQRSPDHFARVLRYGLLFGEVLTTEGDPVGASVCLPPGGWEVTPGRAAEAGLDKLPDILGGEAAGRFFSVLREIDPRHHRDVPAPHWYVMVVGVSPEARGRRLGRALLQSVMDRADASGLPCYLETARPGNVTFYEHLGFRRVAEVVEPSGGLRLWTLRRDPPPAG
jgi:ribosomal protein S18 acetylase RimI-like enzyme